MSILLIPYNAADKAIKIVHHEGKFHNNLAPNDPWRYHK